MHTPSRHMSGTSLGSLGCCATLAAMAAWSSAALAEPVAPTRPWAASTGPTGLGLGPDRSLRLWSEIGLHARGDFTVVRPLFGLGYRPIPQLEVYGLLPMISVDGSGIDGTFVVGNPTLGVSYVVERPTSRWKSGIGFVLPTANVDQAPISADQMDEAARRSNALFTGLFVQGLQDAPWFVENGYAVLFPFRVEQDITSRLTFTVDGFGGLVMRRVTGEEVPRLTVQAALGLAYWLDRRALLGLRLPAAALFLLEGDQAQISLEPYASYNWAHAFVSLRATLPLDRPYGPFTEDNRAWALFLNVGANL